MLTVTNDPRRETILAAARRQFMTDGYASTGMEAVARAAGVSTATLYQHFPGKAELFSHVIDHASVDFQREVNQVGFEDGSVRDQLLSFAVSYAAFMSDPFVRSVFRLVMAERRRFETTATRFFQKGRMEFGSALIGVIARLGAEGRLRILKPSWAAGQLMGMIEHPLFLIPMVTGDDVQCLRSPEDIAADAVDTFLARFGCPSVQG